MKYLSFSSADFHPGVVTCSYKVPDSVEESKIRSSTNSKKLILQFPIVAHSLVFCLTALAFPVYVNYEKERRQNTPLPVKAQPGG